MQLYREGITAIEDIPEDYKLSPAQELYVDIWKYQKSIINKEAIKNFVDSLSYPIYHFDFETFNPAIQSSKVYLLLKYTLFNTQSILNMKTAP